MELVEKHMSAAQLELARTPSGEARSQTTLAYSAIRTDILEGSHKPGAKLKIADLAASLEVSPGAVREALSRLVPERLVVSRDQKGFIVAPLSIEDLQDLTDLRCEIEAIALRRSVEHGDINWEASLLAADHRLHGLPVLLNQNWVRAHAGFHAALVSACGSPRLIALHGQLYEQSERYRGLSDKLESKRDVEGEHREIMRHALARDAERLVGAVVTHIRETTRLIIQSASDQALPD